jgi:hypothetical protein
MPPIHTKMLHLFDMTLHIHYGKNMGYAKVKKIKKCVRARKHGKKKGEIAHISK